MPAISVFTAAHADGAQLERALRSLTAQDGVDWEWVVADDSPDGALDDTLKHCITAEAAQGRVRALRAPAVTRGSIGAAKAHATAACRGDVLAELDHDDELRPGALAAVLDAFARHPEVDFVFSDWVDVMDDEPSALYGDDWAFGFGAHTLERLEGRWTPVTLAPALTWETVRHLVGAPNHLRAWRTSTYRAIGGHDPAQPVADDFALIVRAFLAGRCARIPWPLYVQHHRSDRASASRARNAEIQRRVGELAADHEPALDERCLALGAIPAAPGPKLTGPEPLHGAEIRVVPSGPGAPTVSAVIATYDRPAALRRAIESALAQDHAALEIVVASDGCPHAETVVRAVDDPRVRLRAIRGPHRDGGAAARNDALKTAVRCDLVAYLDDDNVWEPDHVSSLVAALAATPTASWGFSAFTAHGEPIVGARPSRFVIDTSALVHRRALIDAHGAWRTLGETEGAHDWDLASRWLAAGEPWVATKRPTLHYTMADDARGRRILAAMRAAADPS